MQQGHQNKTSDTFEFRHDVLTMVSPVGFVPKSPTLVSPDEACLVITRVMGLKLMSAGLHRALEEVFMSLDTQHRRVNQQDWLRDMISAS